MYEAESISKPDFLKVPLVQYQIVGSEVQVSISTGSGSISEYQVHEPDLTSDLIHACSTIRVLIKRQLQSKEEYTRLTKNFSSELYRTIQERYPSLSPGEIRSIAYFINRDARGLGKIHPLIDDPAVQVISIIGPGKGITLHHAEYGLLLSSIILSKKDIVHLLKKLQNRSISPQPGQHSASVFTIRSGMKVIISDGLDDSDTPSIVIEKPGKSQNTFSSHSKSDQFISEYQLYHNLIQVKVCRSKNGGYFYQIALNRVSENEQSIINSVIDEIRQKNSGSSIQKGSMQISCDEFSWILSSRYPDISKKRIPLLYATYTFFQDIVRWIRVILQDSQVIRIRCTYPGKPVYVWHTCASEGMETQVIPGRIDLNRFADFLIQCSGKKIDPENPEVTLRFTSGEHISLTRVTDDQGHYYRIDIRKRQYDLKRKESSFGEGNNSRKISSTFPLPPIDKTKIEELLTKIFSREDPDSSTVNPREEENNEDNLSSHLGFADRILNPIKSGMKGLSFLGSRKCAGLEKEDPLIPEKLLVESVLNVQIEEGTVAEEAYWLFQPLAYAVIVQDRNKDRSYRIIEPELSPRERIILEETHETLRDVLVYDKPVTRGDLFLEYEEVAKVVRTYDPKISEDRLSVLYYYLRRNLNGYGKIDALMYDELLEDISCNGHNLPVYIHHRYYGSIPTSVRFESEELNRFVLKLSQKADKQVSLTSPLLDASLPNGSRAQITYSDVVSTKGSSFTIRKFRSDPMTPATLLAFGTYSDELLAYIWLALENRQSLLVVGGTASGKTSAMNAFSFFIPHNSKIVSLEDTREIQIPQKNWLPVQTRASNSFSDRGSVDLFDLLKASLRQRPEYIIVGEVRGNEAQTLFQAMNSGHTTLSTLHAGNIEEALNRLTNEPINVPPAMFGALNLMVIQTFHYRGGKMIRRCDAIHEIVLGEDDKVKWNTLFEYEPNDDSFRRVYSKSRTLQTIRYMHNWSEEEIRYQLDLRAGFLAKLRNQYSTDPEILMRMITDVRRLA